MSAHLYLYRTMRTRDENKEQAIREKAIEIIVKEGLDGFGMNKLAKAAGVSPATLYIYYKDKDHLIKKLSLGVVEHMLECSLRDFDADMSFEEGMKIQWRNRLAYFIDFPLEMEFIEIIRYTNIYDSLIPVIKEAFGKRMGRFMQNAIARKELAELPFEVYWSVAFAPLYQLIKFHYQGHSYVNKEFNISEGIVAQALEIVLKALKP